MESIKELRQICQTGKIENKPWRDLINRKISIYFTRIIIPFKISPNQITILSIIIGLIGAYLITTKSITNTIIGFICMYSYLLLDKIDGEIARYKNQKSLKGIFLDELGHMTIPAALFVAIGIKIYLEFNQIPYLIMGFLAGILIILIRAQVNVPYAIYSKKVLAGIINKPIIKTSPELIKTTNITKITRNFFRHLITYFNTLLFLLIGYIIDLNINLNLNYNATQIILITYTTILTISFIAQIYLNYKSINKLIGNIK